LCAPEFGTIFATIFPSPSTTCQCGPSSDGRYMSFPSGVIDMRSHPPSYGFSHNTFSVTRSMQVSVLRVLM
jgi:hypothetical protein